ncbi:MAG TPA: helix-turn-helix transcriptional regulator [Bacilli bacterium]|jgi:DNA-binding XRE family transcriptional regulator|nr:helix-turn-helix transcriptional regulator [Bacilli bacterium]HPA99110.1 helix-turn-helix transcriptional regulator [Bacilli bacterium]
MNYKRLVKELREKLIITQEELAQLLGVSFASINRWETGKHEPTTKIRRKIVQLCKENNIDLEGKE